jgi:Xaa-Pro aminopeptidase
MTKQTNTWPILLIGDSHSNKDLLYASGFSAPDPMVFVQDGSAKHLVVSPLESARAKREGRSLTVWTPEELGLRGKRRSRLSGWAVKLLRKLKRTRAVVPADFPVGAVKYLEQKKIKLKVAKGPLFPGRAVKSADEIRRIRESQQAAVIAMRAAIAAIASAEIGPRGVLRSHGRVLTSESVRSLVAKVLFDHQGFCADLIVACGADSADPHSRGAGPLWAHEPIVIDIFPQNLVHGYWGDLTRTVVRGRASRTVRRMYQAVRAAQNAALGEVRAGARLAKVHGAAAQELKKRGFETSLNQGLPEGFIHSTGHGVGLAIHEQPSVAKVEGRLRTGHVVTVEPGLYYRKFGGVRIEDTVVVTASGWKYLVSCERRLEI